MYAAGFTPMALRQQSDVAFAGVRPEDSNAVLFEPFAVDGVMLYVDPNDKTQDDLAQGGLYDLGEQPLRILEIRGLTALGDISAEVGDRKDLSSMKLTVGGGTPAIDLVTAGVIAGDIVTVYDDSAGITETYTVVEVVEATKMQVDRVISPRALIAPDVFEIKGRDGTVRYTHTLAGPDTLDIDPRSAHTVPVGTPATSRLVFTPPVVVLPSQVLLVSTAAGSTGGWIDVYVVKGSAAR